MATRTCGGGTCNGACASGFFDCNGESLLLVGNTPSSVVGPGTVALSVASHPVWDGLPTTITAESSMLLASGTIVNGGTSIATCSLSTTAPGVVVKDATGGAGRVVHIGQSADYRRGWLTDEVLV